MANGQEEWSPSNLTRLTRDCFEKPILLKAQFSSRMMPSLPNYYLLAQNANYNHSYHHLTLYPLLQLMIPNYF